jgi:hypothetical protein
MNTNLPPNERPRDKSREIKLEFSTNATIGVVILAVGGFFLLKNFGIISWDFDFNWWALFLLIPAGSILQKVWREYQRNGESLNRELRTKLVAGVALLFFGFMLLTGLDWDRYWPLFMIFGGMALLLNSLRSSDPRV